MTIFRVMRELERRGHRCSLWLHDPEGLEPHTSAGLRRRIAADYFPFDGADGDRLRALDGLPTWRWPPAGRRPTRCCGCRAAGHAPTSCRTTSPTSTPPPRSTLLAERTYGLGMPCIAASPWLAGLLRTATAPRPPRSSSAWTPPSTTRCRASRGEPTRRLLRARLHAPPRRGARAPGARSGSWPSAPGLRVVLFGTHNRVRAPFAFEQLGVESTERLRRLYSEATVGLSLSLTNYSLIPNEMLACGLPVVELAAGRARASTAIDGSVITLAERRSRGIAAAARGAAGRPTRCASACPAPAWTSCGAHVGGVRRRDRKGCQGSAVAAPTARGRNFPCARGIDTFRRCRRLEHRQGSARG